MVFKKNQDWLFRFLGEAENGICGFKRNRKMIYGFSKNHNSNYRLFVKVRSQILFSMRNRILHSRFLKKRNSHSRFMLTWLEVVKLVKKISNKSLRYLFFPRKIVQSKDHSWLTLKVSLDSMQYFPVRVWHVAQKGAI